MSTVKRIYKNMIFLSGAEVISRILQFILMIYAARILDQSSFGKFSFALSLGFIATIVADVGLYTFLIREIARNKKAANKYLVNSFVAKLFLAVITFILIAAFVNVLNYPLETQKIVYLILAFLIISTFTNLFYSLFRAFERMFYDALLKITRMLILTAFGLFVLFKFQDVFVFSFTFIIVEIIVLILSLTIASKKFIKIRWKVDFKFIKKILKGSLPFGMSFAFGTVHFYIGSVILSKMKGDIETAIFSVAYNLVLALLFIPEVYTNAIYPVMSRYFKTEKKNLILIYEKSFKYLYILGLPISVGLFYLSNRIIVFFYGKDYISSVIVLQIISWFLFLKIMNFLLGYSLSSIDQQNKRVFSQGLAAAFNITINIALIPFFGFVGAAISILITEIFLFILYYGYISKNLVFYNFFPILFKPIIASLGMIAFIKYSNLELYFVIPASAIVYFGIILLLRTFHKKDYELIKKIMKKQK